MRPMGRLTAVTSQGDGPKMSHSLKPSFLDVSQMESGTEEGLSHTPQTLCPGSVRATEGNEGGSPALGGSSQGSGASVVH